ncbi:MAG: TIGR02266 family protein [Bdellovibrionales bacterium]|nr:TIGR02266 family protein [Bdellovibrionales bacterium]
MIPMKTMAEKRKHRRVPVKFKVDWKSEGTFLFEKATNISEHGIFIETQEPMPPGTMIDLQFTIPDKPKKIVVLGKVAWVNPVRATSDSNYNPGMGIRFENLKEIDRDTILSLIKRIAVL